MFGHTRTNLGEHRWASMRIAVEEGAANLIVAVGLGVGVQNLICRVYNVTLEGQSIQSTTGLRIRFEPVGIGQSVIIIYTYLVSQVISVFVQGKAGNVQLL